MCVSYAAKGMLLATLASSLTGGKGGRFTICRKSRYKRQHELSLHYNGEGRDWMASLRSHGGDTLQRLGFALPQAELDFDNIYIYISVLIIRNTKNMTT